MGKFPLFCSQKRGGNILGRGSEGGFLSLVGSRLSWDRFETIVYSFSGFGPQTVGSLGLGRWGRIGDRTELSRLPVFK